ncbi:MAG TPA: DUF1036 domain-containing protein [Candidatus Baltobacteraceae bacterium]|nr:DUF1036 domain-containing protein [Candidatus Baltobacteraceae bacterium]
MHRWFFVVPLALFAALWLRPVPASAGLHVCNKVSKTVYVAVGTSDLDGDESRGWWRISPGTCKTPIGDDLDTDGMVFYYLYAHASDDSLVWSGADRDQAEAFCTISDAFTIDDCAQGTRRSFRRIFTQDYADYTYDLTT